MVISKTHNGQRSSEKGTSLLPFSKAFTVQDFPGMRRRANSRGGSQFPAQSPDNSPRNHSAALGLPCTLTSEYYSNLHLRYKIHGHKQLRDSSAVLPKVSSVGAKTILRIIAIVFTISGIFSIFDHFFCKTGVIFKLEDGSRRVLAPEQMISGTVAAAKTGSFAVVINTYKRPDLLKNALVHYAQRCGVSTGISQVFVVWADQSSEPPIIEDILPGIPHRKVGNLRSSTSSSGDETQGGEAAIHSTTDNNSEVSFPDIEFLRVAKNSLNSRFLPIENLETKAVFMVDDDVRVDCSSLQAGFQAWTYHPNAMVGYYPRLASSSSSQKSFNQSQSEDHRVYHTWPMVFAKQKFNMILTKASFFHSKYLDMYHDEERNPKEVLEYIDDNKNCEDIAMAFLVARNTKKSVEIDMETSRYCRDCPVFMSGKITDNGLMSGISTGGGSISPKGHMDKRSLCLNAIATIYEKRGWEYPLSDVDLGEQSWTHHLFWWQYTPSNLFEWFSIGNIL